MMLHAEWNDTLQETVFLDILGGVIVVFLEGKLDFIAIMPHQGVYQYFGELQSVHQ